MKNSYRLLMVEDSADDAELLLHSLRDAPFRFSAFRVETEEEYAAALSLNDKPDVVLCDFHLPRFSAERALSMLQARQLDIPFIVVSHHIGEDSAVTAMQNGASDYLLKSRLGRLPRAIEMAIERRSSREQKAQAEQQLRSSETMKRGILNSLTTRIAVLDGSGVIVATNKAWEAFGETDPRLDIGAATVGANYIDLLQSIADSGDESAGHCLAGLKTVIHREALLSSLEYESIRPQGTRWFIARAMPLEGSADGAVVSHEDVTERMVAHHALGEANKRLHAVSKRVLTIQEEERRGISRELHDDIGQSLTALKIGLHRLAQRASERDNGSDKRLLDECLSIAGTTLDRLRNLSLELRPPQLDQLGLADALKWLADQQHSATGMDVNCEFSGIASRLPSELESACYRIAQEALNNATRHAKAGQIRISVALQEHLLTLAINDDGVGFDMDTARKKALRTGSLGLIGMDERAQLAGGSLKVHSVPGAGTSVEVTFDLCNAGPLAAGRGSDLHSGYVQ